MNENIVSLLAASVVAMWFVGACVHQNARQSPQFQAFNQNLLKAENNPATSPEKPVKKQAAKKPTYYRY